MSQCRTIQRVLTLEQKKIVLLGDKSSKRTVHVQVLYTYQDTHYSAKKLNNIVFTHPWSHSKA